MMTTETHPPRGPWFKRVGTKGKKTKCYLRGKSKEVERASEEES
jgi:hypothetical protein